MKRFAIFLYGIVCYAVFFATFLYAVAFIGDLPGIPRSIDGAPLLPSGLALIALFRLRNAGTRKGADPAPFLMRLRSARCRLIAGLEQ